MKTFAPFQAQETARAKINLSLEILARRPDGYHELVSLMATTGLADQLFLSLKPVSGPARPPAGDDDFGWRIASPEEGVPEGPANTCHKAARLFCEQAGIKPWMIDFEVTILKRIPLEAGLGGGSADAAAVLRFLWQCWRKGLPEAFKIERGKIGPDDLLAIALRCGADVPFCLAGGVRFCGGVGEQMTETLPCPAWPLLIGKTPDSVSTAEAFRLLDRARRENPDLEGAGQAWSPEGAGRWEEALGRGDTAATAALIGNDFLEITAQRIPAVASVLEGLGRTDAFAVSMTGSGPSCFALFEDEAGLGRAFSDLSEALPQINWMKTSLSPGPASFPD